MGFSLKDYEDVASRIQRWNEKYPNGRIWTEIEKENLAEGWLLVRTECYRELNDPFPCATDYAFGHRDFYPANMRRFFVEDTVTSSIGRCIGLALSASKRSTAEDMARVDMTPKSREEAWTQPPKEPGISNLHEVVESIKENLGGIVLPDREPCIHGHRIWGEGTKKNGQPWGKLACPEKKCDVIWFVFGSDGKWRKQSA